MKNILNCKRILLIAGLIIPLVMTGQDQQKKALILPFEGINTENAILEKSHAKFMETVKNDSKYSCIPFEDVKLDLSNAGLSDYEVSDVNELLELGTYLEVDYLITAIIGKGANAYAIEIKAIDIHDLDILLNKYENAASQEELYEVSATLGSELTKILANL